MQRKTLTASVYLLAALADSWLLIWCQPLNPPPRFESAFCFLGAVLFALAAALISRGSRFANLCAVAAVVALPYVYTSTLQSNIYTNYWIVFNVPDRELADYGGLLRTELTIASSVTVIVFSIAVGATRSLPNSWMLRRKPIRDRTWPAVAGTLCFLVVWFSTSVMPYRIPGALDYSSWPMLQILHVQKEGLRFHERVSECGGTEVCPTPCRFPGMTVGCSSIGFNRGSLTPKFPNCLGNVSPL